MIFDMNCPFLVNLNFLNEAYYIQIAAFYKGRKVFT